mmetsp:Transcript_15770/g.49573  ORF Transcript_15770/g.49573 Transcript_15770/m.49573 type:complete len:365 (+) Transcript_15770:216-1310(+)
MSLILCSSETAPAGNETGARACSPACGAPVVLPRGARQELPPAAGALPLPPPSFASPEDSTTLLMLSRLSGAPCEGPPREGADGATRAGLPLPAACGAASPNRSLSSPMTDRCCASPSPSVRGRRRGSSSGPSPNSCSGEGSCRAPCPCSTSPRISTRILQMGTVGSPPMCSTSSASSSSSLSTAPSTPTRRTCMSLSCSSVAWYTSEAARMLASSPAVLLCMYSCTSRNSSSVARSSRSSSTLAWARSQRSARTPARQPFMRRYSSSDCATTCRRCVSSACCLRSRSMAWALYSACDMRMAASISRSGRPGVGEGVEVLGAAGLPFPERGRRKAEGRTGGGVLVDWAGRRSGGEGLVGDPALP